MGVGTTDTERRNPRATGMVGAGPGAFFGQQAHRARVPVNVRRGLTHVQGPGQFPGAQGHHHLDDAGDARGGLGVSEVRLHRAQPQRLGALAPLAVGSEQRLGLDGIAEPGSGAVRLDDVHFGRRDPRGLQRLADHALLRRTVRRAQPVRGAVLVNGAAADHCEHLVAQPLCLGQPLQYEHAGALGPGGAVRGLRERLAPAVGSEATLPGELHERRRGGHHGDATGERHPALAGP